MSRFINTEFQSVSETDSESDTELLAKLESTFDSE